MSWPPIKIELLFAIECASDIKVWMGPSFGGPVHRQFDEELLRAGFITITNSAHAGSDLSARKTTPAGSLLVERIKWYAAVMASDIMRARPVIEPPPSMRRLDEKEPPRVFSQSGEDDAFAMEKPRTVVFQIQYANPEHKTPIWQSGGSSDTLDGAVEEMHRFAERYQARQALKLSHKLLKNNKLPDRVYRVLERTTTYALRVSYTPPKPKPRVETFYVVQSLSKSDNLWRDIDPALYPEGYEAKYDAEFTAARVAGVLRRFTMTTGTPTEFRVIKREMTTVDHTLVPMPKALIDIGDDDDE